MEDGNFVGATDDKHGPQLTNLYSDLAAPRITTNGHTADVIPNRDNVVKPHYEHHEGLYKQRINPLKIHLGKRPFVDNSIHYQSGVKRKSTVDRLTPPTHRNIHQCGQKPVPKLIQRKGTNNQFQHALASHKHRTVSDGKPVPRLIPKSQLSQFKKGKVEKGHQFNEYAQYLGLQPMMQYKCSKCCAMFNTLILLNEHQPMCRVQAKEPTPTPEVAPSMDNSTLGPSRVTKKVFLCSACGTYYENWNLFLHMREIHNRHICLFCLGMFSKAQKLAAHLTNKHNVTEHSFNTNEEFCNMYNDSFYLMCCTCGEVYSEQDDFFSHDCNNIKPKPVPVLVSKNAKSNIKLNKNLSITNSPAPPPVIAPDKLTIEPVKDDEPVVENNDLVSLLPAKTVTQTEESEGHLDASNAEKLLDDCDINNKMPAMTEDNDESTDTATESLTSLNSTQESDRMLNLDKITEELDQSSVPMNMETPVHSNLTCKDEKCTTNEKDCGIKLKLSLNNSTKSPVIINSTVDPSVGRGVGSKPPSRVRRPPKRYEKETKSPSQPLTPTIKMTICDKADSSFVKSTIIESKDDPTSALVINNDLDVDMKQVPNVEHNEPVICDNGEHENTLNRIPKLKVKLSKGLQDRNVSSDYTSDSDTSDKLMVDEMDHKEKDAVGITAEAPVALNENNGDDHVELPFAVPNQPPMFNVDCVEEEADNIVNSVTEMAGEEFKMQKPEEESQLADSSAVNDEVPVTELTLDKPLDKYPLKDLLKVFVKSTAFNCIYCNHVRKIATNCEHLSLHMVAEHQFSATVNSITAEELLPETITARVKTGAPELRSVFINLDTYDSVDKNEAIGYDHVFECFQCYYKSAIHKELYLHNRKIHQNILLCVMCKTNFYNYSELLCHLCPGRYDTSLEIKFRCYLCNYDRIPSTFRLMVHLRKNHHTCDVCLEHCHDQTRLSNHVWKHKLHHLCYRCGIAYRNKPDITRHLFWKHGTESVMCKKCLQKKWPHVYHFCTPPITFICEECSLSFTRAVSLRVHKRFHTEEFPHICTEEGCKEKFVSKKLMMKHVESHKPGNPEETEPKEQNITIDESKKEEPKDVIPVIDLVNDKTEQELKISTDKTDKETEPLSKKAKKKKVKDSDLLLDVNLPELNLSESDSESDEEHTPAPVVKSEVDVKDQEVKLEEEQKPGLETDIKTEGEEVADNTQIKVEEKAELVEDEKSNEQKVLDIWDNFKKYQAKVERKKTPPLVPIKKHVCESDHDYCIIPSDLNGDEEFENVSRKIKKSPKKRGDDSSSSSSSSDSDSSCPCGSNCSCSSSSGSSSSSSSDSDSSHLSDRKERKKQYKKTLPNRRTSCGSQQSAVDVMGMADPPLLVAEKQEPLIAESDLETEESETDEEFYDEYPQRLANKLLAEKRNQLMLLASVAPSDNGSVSGDISRCATPLKIEHKPKKDKSSSKKKSKKKKKSKSSKKTSLKLNIPKEFLKMPKNESKVPFSQLAPNKITISLQSNKVQLPESTMAVPNAPATSTPLTSQNKKRASKRRRVPNKFYGYSSEEENSFNTSTTLPPLLKPQLPPKLEWRKEDLPAPVPTKAKKEVPPVTIPHRFFSSFPEPLRLTAPIPDPEPPRILMNSESMESSDSESSHDGRDIPEPPAHLNSGTSSLPYPFVRPPVREAREGESVYCYCRCPYDEVSEMIACDAVGCTIEWFHFECVGIMVPPKGKWYCPECRKRNSAS